MRPETNPAPNAHEVFDAGAIKTSDGNQSEQEGDGEPSSVKVAHDPGITVPELHFTKNSRGAALRKGLKKFLKKDFLCKLNKTSHATFLKASN